MSDLLQPAGLWPMPPTANLNTPHGATGALVCFGEGLVLQDEVDLVSAAAPVRAEHDDVAWGHQGLFAGRVGTM